MARTQKRNNQKMDIYKRAMNFCHDPNCKFGYGLETHHIQPLAKGGEDTYSNYIVLCWQCHRKHGIHSRWSKHQIRLLTYKFFEEKMRIGLISDDVSELAFHNALFTYLEAKEADMRTPDRLAASDDVQPSQEGPIPAA